MSYKQFSMAQGVSSGNKPNEKSKDAPAVDQPATQPVKEPAADTPAVKS